METSTFTLKLILTEFPGMTCGPLNSFGDPSYTNVHLAGQVGKEHQILARGDSAGIEHSMEIPLRAKETGFEYGGPLVNGITGEKFVYLAWGAVYAGGVQMFRRMKIRLPYPALPGSKSATLILTDKRGEPVCATVKPPNILWS